MADDNDSSSLFAPLVASLHSRLLAAGYRPDVRYGVTYWIGRDLVALSEEEAVKRVEQEEQRQ